MTGNGHSKGSAIATEQFYVALELARVGRNSIAIKEFWVVTELAMTESSTAYDRAGHAKAGAHDRSMPHCVVIKEAMCMHQTRSGRGTDQARHT